MITVLIGLALMAPCALGVVSEDELPGQAQWISPTTNSIRAASPSGKSVLLRRGFSCGAQVIKAVLLVASTPSEVFVNNSRVGSIESHLRAASFDVTSIIRPGTNDLSIRFHAGEGPRVLRAILELAASDGRQRWVVSDPSWTSEVQDAAAPLGTEPAVALSGEGISKWGDPFGATRSVDAYNSWMLAQKQGVATDPGAISAPPGFVVERMRSAVPGEDSWIALAFDPKGRLTVAKEKKGLLRMTLGPERVRDVEVIEETLEECRGLLYAHGFLYVNANNSRRLVRLEDRDDDGVFENRRTLLETPDPGVGHGRNQLALGPDGLIYLVHGDDVSVPPGSLATSPVRQTSDDQLLPFLPRRSTNSLPRQVRTGHVLQTDRDGSFFRMFATGLRNPMDAAFNEDGELFTYDADMERDIGTPWYHPTRVLHLVPGGDYGWRRSLGNIPPYAADVLPSAEDIGVGSPTGVVFGTGSGFPDRYRKAFFIADWSYGRILAVHLKARGAGYVGRQEPFIAGRPLNVTDMVIGPDGAMFFITGGRGTQSGLYRVRWNGGSPDSTAQDAGDPGAPGLRALRRRLESSHQTGKSDGMTAEAMAAGLSHPDRWIRYAARIALEKQGSPVGDLASRLPMLGRIETWLAIVRNEGAASAAGVIDEILQIPLNTQGEGIQLGILRVLGIVLARHGVETDVARARIARYVIAGATGRNRWIQREVVRILAGTGSSELPSVGLANIETSRAPEDRLLHLQLLTTATAGWDEGGYRRYFEALRVAEQSPGARDYRATVSSLRERMSARLTEEQRQRLRPLLVPAKAEVLSNTPAVPLKVIREWKLSDVDLSIPAKPGAASRGRAHFASLCASCHRAREVPGGVVGPDLTSVSARFNRRDILSAILEPSLAMDEKYAVTEVTDRHGEMFAGFLEHEDEDHLLLGSLSPDEASLRVRHSDVVSRRLSTNSPMPRGLLDVLTEVQIQELLEFLSDVSGER